MAAENLSLLEKINKQWVVPLLAILTGITTYSYHQQEQMLNSQHLQLQTQKTQLDAALAQKTYDNNVKVEVFNNVINLTTGTTKADLNKQKIINLMVREMLADYPDYRDKMLKLMDASDAVDNNIKVENDSLKAAEIKYKTEEIEAKATTNINKVTIDIFYLDDILSDNPKKTAESLQAKINKQYPNYVPRVRLLPKLINAQKGYRIEANQIRFEEKERPYAQQVYDLIEKNGLTPLEKPSMHPIKYQTPNYISVFIRNK